MTSLWTTGILVASSIFVLAFTSALVAFDRWPGAAAGAQIDHVTVSAPAPAVQKVIARPRVAAGPARHGASGTTHVRTHTTSPSAPTGTSPSSPRTTAPAPPRPTGPGPPGTRDTSQSRPTSTATKRGPPTHTSSLRRD